MKMLDKSYNAKINVEPNEGERTLLSSNESGMRSPSLDFLDTSADSVTEEMILDYLARIISDIYLQETHGNNTEQKSSDLLPRINKRTG